jgi:ATP-dependent RNA helicase RhlE
MISFSELALRPEIQQALARQGYETPTPIQAQAIPSALAGRDLLGIAQTGTGKTAAFTLPILQKLSEGGAFARPGQVRALILTPTRELAIQIGESIASYGHGLRMRHAVIFGGVGQGRQVDALAAGLDLLVATPGRLLDLMQQRHAKLDGISIFVLDEADRMLDMGFIHDVRKIVAKLPKQRQTLFFSATMPDEIATLSSSLLNEPVRIEVAPASTTAERIEQRLIHVPGSAKRQLLVELLAADETMSRVIVFTRTKHGANRVADYLERAGQPAAAIHGNKSQNARQAALNAFRVGKMRVLVATDIAARGIDIDEISHVVNFDLPNVPETYVHRIGRTARAGASGIAIAFCDNGEERGFLRGIERLTRVPLKVMQVAIPTTSLPEVPSAPRPAANGRPSTGRSGYRGDSSRSGEGRNGDSRSADSRNGEGRGGDVRGDAKPRQYAGGRPAGAGAPGKAFGAPRAASKPGQRPAGAGQASAGRKGGFGSLVTAINTGDRGRGRG